MSIETDIVDAIISDIESRKGIGDEWGEIDSEIQDEIYQEWESIVHSHLAGILDMGRLEGIGR